MASNSAQPLAGISVLLLALNVPGPVAAQRLKALGATVVKIEGPGGDPLATMVPSWYAELCTHFDVQTIDLKTESGHAHINTLLANADVLITSFRPSSLERLQLGAEQVALRYPRLCQVAIVGNSSPNADVAGHDLTYQATAGLLTPPGMPVTLLADLFGAERAASAAMTLMYRRSLGETDLLAEVSLEHSVQALTAPIRHRATAPDGPLSGVNPLYRLYKAKTGWIALAALEPHFIVRLRDAFAEQIANSKTDFPDAEMLQQTFALRPAAEWEAWGIEHDIPIVMVRSAATLS